MCVCVCTRACVCSQNIFMCEEHCFGKGVGIRKGEQALLLQPFSLHSDPPDILLV